jgi:hypothetical protein
VDHPLGTGLHHRTHQVPHLIQGISTPAGGSGEGTAIAGQGGARYHKRDFWADENLKYAEPHFRMRKVAREVRRIYVCAAR